MEEWIRDTFKILLKGWETEHGGDAFAFTGLEGSCTASVDWFVAQFGQVETPPTYENLIKQDPGNVTGWHKHFESWKEQNLIS